MSVALVPGKPQPKPEPEIIATERGLRDFIRGGSAEPGRADSDPRLIRKAVLPKPEPEIIATERGFKDFIRVGSAEPGRADSDPKPKG